MEAFDQLDSILWIGKKLMEYGADSAHVEEAMYAYANGIGVEQMDALVLPRSVLVTIYLGDEYKTKMKHVGDLVPNLGKASRIYEYAKNPDGKKHELYEGSEKSQYTCKCCGSKYSSLSSLTSSSCSKSPTKKHQPAM